jgi:hypothetical protein
MGRTDHLQDWIERRIVVPRCRAEAEKLADRALLAR